MVSYAELLELFTEKYFSLICLFLCLYYLYFTYKNSSPEILKIVFCTPFKSSTRVLHVSPFYPLDVAN